MLYLEIFLKLTLKGDSNKCLLVGKLSLFKVILQDTKFSQKLVFFNVVSRKMMPHSFSPLGGIFCHVTKNVATCVPYNLFGVWVSNCTTCVNDIMKVFNYKQIIELKN
jgi:hypothetical protein